MVPLILLASLLVTIDLRSEDGAMSARVVRGIRSETTTIWRPYGVEIRWVGGREEAAVVDVALTALIERRALPPAESHLVALGNVHLRIDLQTDEPIHLSYRAVAELLDRRPSDRRALATRFQGFADVEMGRALGRVLAHEVGHVLLGAPFHRATGLMRPQFTADELASPDRTRFVLTAGDLARLRSRFDRGTAGW
jgi:hypothetical protein